HTATRRPSVLDIATPRFESGPRRPRRTYTKRERSSTCCSVAARPGRTSLSLRRGERGTRLPASTFDAVPRDLATVVDRHWLAAALDNVGDDDRIIGVEQVGSSRTIAEKVRLRVTVEGADGVREHMLCAKAHFDNGPNSLLTEAHVYRELRPRLDMRA